MRILSVDPANKSLAISIIDFNTNWENDLIAIKKKYIQLYDDAIGTDNKILVLWERTQKVAFLMESLFSLKYINVFDLLPYQKVDSTTTELRLSRLKGVISYVKKINSSLTPTTNIEQVLVEKQMSQKNMEVSSALIYAFTEPDFAFLGKGTYITHDKDELESRCLLSNSTKVAMVGASLKSKVYFGSNGNIQHFRKKYMGNYTANKAHSKYNFLEWIKEKDIMDMIKGIPKKNIDDIADSFIMAYAWCLKTYKVN
jgi:hypothetical protein